MGGQARGVDVVAAQVEHQAGGKARVLLAVGFVHLLPRQGFAVGEGVNQQPFDMRGLQYLAAALFIIGNGGGQYGGQVVIDHFHIGTIQLIQIHFRQPLVKYRCGKSHPLPPRPRANARSSRCVGHCPQTSLALLPPAAPMF